MSSRLGEAFSPERDRGVAQNVNWPLRRALEAESWASLCYSHLGETSSLGREYQFSPTVLRMQPRNNQTKHLTFDLTQAQTFSNSFYATTEGKTSTYNERRKKKLASLTLLRC